MVMRVLEVCVVVAVMAICTTVFVQQNRIASPEELKLFQEMLGRSAQEGNLITGIMMAMIGFVAVPFGYVCLWLHRLDKYMTIRRYKGDQDRLMKELNETQNKGNSGINMKKSRTQVLNGT